MADQPSPPSSAPLLRPSTGISPRTASQRPPTRNEPHTVRLDTSNLQTFHPDEDHRDYPDDDDEYCSEEDEDVFAFERPTTAAPKVVKATEMETMDPQLAVMNPIPILNHTRHPSNLSTKPSLISASSYIATTDGGYTTDADDSDVSMVKKIGKRAYRMRHLLKKDVLEAIPGSRDGSRALTGRPGASTIPDGRTTRGDGVGNMMRQWTREQDVGHVHFEEGEEEDSPYEEVRASVSNIDDPDMPALTWRVWFLGLLFLVVRSGLETVFQFRNPSASFPLLSIQLFVYPLGKLLAWLMPLKRFQLPRCLGGFVLDLNPGPFNIKENTLIVIMADVIVCPSLHAITAAEVYLGADLHSGFMTLFILGAELVGVGLAGLGHLLLVEPASMIWPYNLVIATFLNTFHAEEDVQPGKMTRFRFFMIAFVGAFAYCFLPGFLFTALSYFSWVCWIKPESRVVNQLFGVVTGLGMGVVTFDWMQILYIGSPLMVPWWAQANAIVGFVIFYWIICPILYYSNVWNTAYMPISTGQIMDRFAAPYNITTILHKTNIGKLDEAAYHAYSPVYISVTFAMTFTLAFALSTACIVHTILYHGPQIWRALRLRQVEAPDIHAKLMRSYRPMPFWSFACLAVIGFVLSIVSVEIFHTGYPVYVLLISLLIPVVYFLPAGFLLATSSQSLTINAMAQLMPGYLLPGDALVNMLSKSYSSQVLLTASQVAQDMKLAHYMKIPPLVTFTVQLSAVIGTIMTQIAVKEALFFNIPDICSSAQKDSFTCPWTSLWFRSGILWGSVGPAKVFGNGALYHYSVYAAVAGVIIPIPFWLLGRRFKRSIFRMVNFGVLFNSLLSIPPATGVNYASFLVVGFVFQYLIRRRASAWWSRFNYILSAALVLGTLLSVFFIFLALGIPNVSLSWAGNTIYQKTYDWIGVSYLAVPAKGFGPDNWK